MDKFETATCIMRMSRIFLEVLHLLPRIVSQLVPNDEKGDECVSEAKTTQLFRQKDEAIGGI